MSLRTILRRWRSYQQTIRELSSLNNRQLDSLGISRKEIAKIARDHARSIR